VVFVLVFLYYVFPFSARDETHVVDLLNAGQTSGGVAKDGHDHSPILHDVGDPPAKITKEMPKPVHTSSTPPGVPAISASADDPKATQAAIHDQTVSQELFNVESDALGV